MASLSVPHISSQFFCKKFVIKTTINCSQLRISLKSRPQNMKVLHNIHPDKHFELLLKSLHICLKVTPQTHDHLRPQVLGTTHGLNLPPPGNAQPTATMFLSIIHHGQLCSELHTPKSKKHPQLGDIPPQQVCLQLSASPNRAASLWRSRMHHNVRTPPPKPLTNPLVRLSNSRSTARKHQPVL